MGGGGGCEIQIKNANSCDQLLNIFCLYKLVCSLLTVLNTSIDQSDLTIAVIKSVISFWKLFGKTATFLYHVFPKNGSIRYLCTVLGY